MKDNSYAMMPYPYAEVSHASSGPLSGLTFAVKDLFDIAGYPTGGGNPVMLAMSGIKTETAPTVQKLLDAGAQFIGKAHTNEMAFSMSGHNAHYGTPINGGAPARIPGGSSSGSASAVSNSLCDFALGTDTGGSVRTPAAYCGLFGIRPTHGRISLEKCQPLCESMDTCGYFTRDAETFVRVGDVLLGEDRVQVDTATLKLHPVLFSMLPSTTQEALKPALEAIASSVERIEYLDCPLPDLETAYWDFRYIQGYEAWQTQGKNIEVNHLVLGPDVASRFGWSKTVTYEQYELSLANREAFRDAWEAILGNHILIMPTVPGAAPLREASGDAIEQERQLAHHILDIAVLCQWPQVNIPLAEVEGAPLGISLMGPAGSDMELIRLAAKIASR